MTRWNIHLIFMCWNYIMIPMFVLHLLTYLIQVEYTLFNLSVVSALKFLLSRQLDFFVYTREDLDNTP